MKKICILICCTFMAFGCGNNNNNLETKGNCVVFDCINKIEPKNTVEDINEIIGFDGELIDEKYNKYYWELSDTSSITVTYYSSTLGDITIDYNKEYLKNNKVDFSHYDELQDKVKSGITYNDFINYIGNIDGTIVEKNSSSIKYIWVDKDGKYLNASFSNSTGKCNYTTGML